MRGSVALFGFAFDWGVLWGGDDRGEAVTVMFVFSLLVWGGVRWELGMLDGGELGNISSCDEFPITSSPVSYTNLSDKA